MRIIFVSRDLVCQGHQLIQEETLLRRQEFEKTTAGLKGWSLGDGERRDRGAGLGADGCKDRAVRAARGLAGLAKDKKAKSHLQPECEGFPKAV